MPSVATARPVTHRARGLARRDALLQAAVEIVAERGVGGATHRAIAQRANVPPSTTTYFFASIDELIVAAIQRFAQQRVDQYLEIAGLLRASDHTADEVATLFAQMLTTAPIPNEIAQFEAYLDAGRRGADQPRPIGDVIRAFETVAISALEAVGVEHPEAAAPAFIALADGYSVRRIALGEASDPAEIADVFLRLLDSYKQQSPAA